MTSTSTPAIRFLWIPPNNHPLPRVVDGYNVVDTADNFRPEILTRLINLKKGNIYRREDQELTLSHLMGLGVFKFVNIKFSEVNKDSLLLNADIHLTPLKKKSLRTEIQMTSKSNNFVGPGLSFTFSNRNFLRGWRDVPTPAEHSIRGSD